MCVFRRILIHQTTRIPADKLKQNLSSARMLSVTRMWRPEPSGTTKLSLFCLAWVLLWVWEIFGGFLISAIKMEEVLYSIWDFKMILDIFCLLGAFLIPYFISLFCMGLPIFLFEMGAGQFSSKGPIRVWNMCPLFEGMKLYFWFYFIFQFPSWWNSIFSTMFDIGKLKGIYWLLN